MIINSKLLELKNSCYAFFQNKFENTACCKIFNKIEEIILLFIGITLLASTFMQSEHIAVFALIVVLLTFLKLLVKKGAKVVITGFDAALIIYFLICLISTVNSTLLPQSLHGFLKTVVYILYYFSAANYFQTNQSKIKYVLFFISLLCCVEGLIALYQNFAGVEQISTWQDLAYVNPEDAIARAYGTLKPYNPNLLGGYLVCALPCIIGAGAMLLINRHFKSLIAGVVMLLITSLAVFVTGSRGAYLGLGAIAAGFVILVTIIINTDFKTQEKLKSVWHKIVAALCAAFALLLIAVPKITKRILSIFILRGDSSTSFRMNVYNSSWHMFCDNWLLGIGAGNQTFREIYGLYMLTGFDALSTYSVPLEIAVEAGIFALIAFAVFIVWFIIDGYKFITNNDSAVVLADKAIVCAAILTVAGVMMHGMFDTIYFRPQVQFVFWTMIAMASAVIVKNDVRNESGIN